METGLLAGTHCTETQPAGMHATNCLQLVLDGHETSRALVGLDSALESSEANSEISSALEPTPTPEHTLILFL